MRLTVSIGLAAAPPHDVKALPERANVAKAEAKRLGRNAVCVARADGVKRMCVRADTPAAQATPMWRGAFR